MKFRKKPVVIDAFQITDEWFDGAHPNPLLPDAPGIIYDPVERTATVRTLEGDMVGRVGHWLIRGLAGEWYPCHPDIFEATYEKEA